MCKLIENQFFLLIITLFKKLCVHILLKCFIRIAFMRILYFIAFLNNFAHILLKTECFFVLFIKHFVNILLK